jgi:hypothetical protein
MAGSDFSIFVNIHNPFEVPITIYQVQTHIPVELIDVNWTRQHWVNTEPAPAQLVKSSFWGWLRAEVPTAVRRWFLYRGAIRHRHTGVAIAVGTDFDPNAKRDFIATEVNVQTAGERSTIAGVMFNFPKNPSTEELDQIFSRLADYRSGLIPVHLQPGDSVVKQFVLKTRRWLFFTPLTHRFQIQVNYAADGVEHSDTISYEQTIRSGIAAVSLGAAVGGIVGTLLKTLMRVSTPDTSTSHNPFGESFWAALAVSVLASLAVVVAFARKSAAQPIVSVEDFWGGALIGFSTSFFGFEQFRNLFTPK